MNDDAHIEADEPVDHELGPEWTPAERAALEKAMADRRTIYRRNDRSRMVATEQRYRRHRGWRD